MKMISLKAWKKTFAKQAAADQALAFTPRTVAPSIVEIGKGRDGVDKVRAVMVANGADDNVIERALDMLSDGDVTATYTMSTDVVDRPGDRIMQEGWDLEEFRENPIFLFGHDASSPPIGKALATYLSKQALKGTFKFTPEATYGFGAMIGRLVKGGFLPACSVGFSPTEWRIAEDRVDPEDPWSEWFPPLDFIKQKLLELSAVPIPANPEALVDGKGLDSSDAKMIRSWAEAALAGEGRALVLPRGLVERMAKTGKTATISVVVKDGVDGEEPTIELAPAAAPTKADPPVDEPVKGEEEETEKAAGYCPGCGMEAPLEDFKPKDVVVDADKSVIDATDATLLRELRRRGFFVPAAKRASAVPLAPLIVEERAAEPRTLPSESGQWHAEFESPEALGSFAKSIAEEAVSAAMLQLTGKLPD